MANLTPGQFTSNVANATSAEAKSVLDMMALLLKSTTESEPQFPPESGVPFHFHSPQERLNFQEHLCTVLTEMFLRGSKVIDSSRYMVDMDTLVLSIFDARKEAFREGLLLLGAIALCSTGTYENEFSRIKEYLVFALKKEESRELVLGGCEMLSNITEAMGVALHPHLPDLVEPIIQALRSKKIFIEEKISACEALGELAIRTGSVILQPGQMPWLDYVHPAVDALLSLADRSFRGLSKKLDVERRKVLFKLQGRIMETLSCIFFHSSHPEIANALAPTIP